MPETQWAMGRLQNARHEAFARHYAKTGCKAEAARRAGYPDRGHDYASKYGHVLMKNHEVTARVEELIRRGETEKKLTPDAILAAITDIAMAETTAPRDRLNALTKLGEAMETPMFGTRQKTEGPPDAHQVLVAIRAIVPPEAVAGVAKAIGIDLEAEDENEG